MKTKLMFFALIAVFSVSLFPAVAWTSSTAGVYEKRSYGYHYNYLWIKTFYQLLKLEKRVAVIEDSVDKNAKGIDQEAMERQAGDEGLQLSIDNEAEIREKADITLLAEIDKEAAKSDTGDEQLQQNLDNETAARENADMDLQEQIDSMQPGGGAEFPIFFSSGGVVIEPAKFWRMGVGFATAESTERNYGIIMPMAGTIKGLNAFSLVNPSSTPDPETITFTVLVNNGPTEVTCTITNGLTCDDVANQVIVEPKDKVAILVFASMAAKTSVVGASVVLEN